MSPENLHMTAQSAPEVLNDLIQVNSERIARYEYLITNVDPADRELRYLFAKIIGKSYQYKIILATELHDMGESINLTSSKKGTVYNSAFEFLGAVSGGNRRQILSQSQECEEAVLKAYSIALMSEDVAAYLRDLLIEHHVNITQSGSEIKLLRDQTA